MLHLVALELKLQKGVEFSKIRGAVRQNGYGPSAGLIRPR
jgi:hypothetical protein